MVSAQLMSLWAPHMDDHSGWRCQALQCLAMMILMTMPELGSENAEVLRKSVEGFMGQRTSPCCKCLTHHARSAAAPLIEQCGMKGLS